MTSSWMSVESTSMTTSRPPRRARPGRGDGDVGADLVRDQRQVAGAGRRRRRRRRRARRSSPGSATAAGCGRCWRRARRSRPRRRRRACVSSGAPMTTTAARPVRRGALSPRPATRSTRIPSRDPARVSRSTSTFSSRPGESSTDRARWPRTTTCSRSSTSAPTVEAASNSALVTPGRSGPLRVTRRVRAFGSGSGAAGGSIGAGGTRAGYRAWASRQATRSRTGPRS